MGKHFEDYKKAYLNRRRELPREARVERNGKWRKRWLPFIKYDHDFDFAFFIAIIVHKLHLMLDFYSDAGSTHMQEDQRLKLIEELKFVCDRGELLLSDNFDEAAADILDKHTALCECPDGQCANKVRYITEWDSPESEKLYRKAAAAAEEYREQTIEEFFDFIKKHYREWWD